MVSVIPYMLTRTGAVSGCRSYQSVSRAGSSASPPKTTRRRASRAPSSGCSASARIRGENAEGVWLSTVTRSSTSRRRNSSGERVTSFGTTTSRPPCSSAPQISQTEKSKAYEWNSVHTSCSSKANQSWVRENSRTTLACGTTTPLGRPVEPEV